ncbi:MAG TPA: hypothetical protein VGS19_37695 [Streptosporangiaceae bacterium]|nr:hypothetical protein [Streptosporangiaceae bacterium]
MNDEELLTVVRQQRTKLPMTIPVEQIISRGRVIRARRRIPGLATVLAVVAVAVLAVTTLLPSSHPRSPRPGIQLAAWTVVKHANGTVDVTIRELRNPAALQAKLRADGVPASVIFGNQPNPCQSYGHPELLSKVITPSTAPGQPQGHAIVMTIHPSALPGSAGVQIITNLSNVGFHLVTASQGCTGS